MAKYIECEKVVELFNKWADGYSYIEVPTKDAIACVRAIPAADVRPVVTCGKCEFWNRERISCEGLARCNNGESGIRYRNRNDFCSRGVKREES